MNEKNLIKSKDKIIAGVCGGIAEYFGFDITITRLVYTVPTFFTAFAGIPVYIVLWILMPKAKI